MGAQVYINEEEKEALEKAQEECKNFLGASTLPRYHESHGDVPERLQDILQKVRRAESNQ